MVFWATTNIAVATWAPNTGQWYHIAVVRSGTTVTLYIDGTEAASGTKSGSIGSSSEDMRIGSLRGTQYFYNGYLDEIRISKIARWTGNFLPPESSY